MMRTLLWTLLGLWAQAALAQTPDVPKWAFAARVEYHLIPSQTLSDEQFLRGDANGPTVQLTAELRLPQGSQAKWPAVVIMHGSGGISPANQNWAQVLNQAGYASLVVDSFTGRGLVQVSTDQARLGRFAGVLDAFRSYEVLARHPRIDPDRIAFLGTSRGGTAVIYTAMKRFQALWSPQFKGWATFPLYPSCFDRLDRDDEVSMPIHAFHGEIDDYASKAPCLAWVDRLAAQGRVATNTVYPQAAHGYDNLLSSTTPVVSPGAQSTRMCRISERAGALINTEENKPFAYTDRCVTRDPSIGHNPAATVATQKAVLQALQALSR